MAGNRALALGAIEKYKNAPLGHFVNGASLPGEVDEVNTIFPSRIIRLQRYSRSDLTQSWLKCSTMP